MAHLIELIRNGDIAKIKAHLIYFQEDTNKTVSNMTPLTIALNNSSEEIIELLLKHGAEVFSIYDDETPFMRAMKRGVSTVDMLMKYVPKSLKYFCFKRGVYDYESDMKNIFKFAIDNNRIYIIILLKYCNNYERLDIFSEAMELNNKHVIDHIINTYGPNMYTEMFGVTLLMKAAHLNRKDIIKQLIDAGANVHAQTRGDNYTAETYPGGWTRQDKHTIKLLSEYPFYVQLLNIVICLYTIPTYHILWITNCLQGSDVLSDKRKIGLIEGVKRSIEKLKK